MAVCIGYGVIRQLRHRQYRPEMEQQAMETKVAVALTSNRMEAGLIRNQSYKTEEDHPNIEKLTALIIIMPTHYLLYGNMRYVKQ